MIDEGRPAAPPRVVVMGVAGSGKSTVGAGLAAALGVSFVDGDDLHPVRNRRLMAAGTALTDADRAPWLTAVRDLLAASPGGVVVACSALRRAYRDVLRRAGPVGFVELDVPDEVLTRRLTDRPAHFMPAALLASQLVTLEPLAADERGVRVDGTRPPTELIAELREVLSRPRT